jgi:hypothetical protein
MVWPGINAATALERGLSTARGVTGKPEWERHRRDIPDVDRDNLRKMAA